MLVVPRAAPLFSLLAPTPSVSVTAGAVVTTQADGSASSSVWLRVEVSDDAKAKYLDAMKVVDKLAQETAAAKRSGTQFDLDAKRERLRLLKLFAKAAIATGDAKSAKAIAEEIGQIAHQLERIAVDAGLGPATPAPAPSPEATAPDAAAPAEAAPDAAAGNAATPAAPATSDDADAETLKKQIRELLQTAKKIIDKLRRAFANDPAASREINKAAASIGHAADRAGVSLADSPDDLRETDEAPKIDVRI